MFYQNLLSADYPIMDEFLKWKAHSLVSTIFKDRGGIIEKEEVPYIIRYFLKFPSNYQVSNEILPEVEKFQTEDLPKKQIGIEAVEKYLIQLLKTNQYCAYEPEVLLEAFRKLDVEKNGYLDLYTLYSFLGAYENKFSKVQREDMDKFIKDNESDLLDLPKFTNDDNENKIKTTTARKFYYENYVKKVFEDNARHFDEIMKEYNDYKNEFLETKKYRDLPPLISKEVQDKLEEEEKKKKEEEEKKQSKAAEPPKEEAKQPEGSS